MAAASFVHYCFLAYFSRPKADRAIFRLMRRIKPRRIVEIGLDSHRRTLRLIQTAQRFAQTEAIEYTGIDLFEARPKSDPSFGLKETFRRLRPSSATVKLVPGDPFSALARAANTLTGSDLVLISAGHDGESLRMAWKFLPRMLHDGSLVLLESSLPSGQTRWETLEHGRVHQFASAARIATRRAA